MASVAPGTQCSLYTLLFLVVFIFYFGIVCSSHTCGVKCRGCSGMAGHNISASSTKTPNSLGAPAWIGANRKKVAKISEIRTQGIVRWLGHWCVQRASPGARYVNTCFRGSLPFFPLQWLSCRVGSLVTLFFLILHFVPFTPSPFSFMKTPHIHLLSLWWLVRFSFVPCKQTFLPYLVQ